LPTNRPQSHPFHRLDAHTKGPMSCTWVLLPSIEYPRQLCGKPGYPLCPEHQREMDAMQKAKDWMNFSQRSRPAANSREKSGGFSWSARVARD